MLEQQLEKTRVMVLQAERDRAEALRRMAALQADNTHVDNAERRSYIDKISDLEREQLKLMATQTLAQVTPEMLLGRLLILCALLVYLSTSVYMIYRSHFAFARKEKAELGKLFWRS